MGNIGEYWKDAKAYRQSKQRPEPDVVRLKIPPRQQYDAATLAAGDELRKWTGGTVEGGAEIFAACLKVYEAAKK